MVLLFEASPGDSSFFQAPGMRNLRFAHRFPAHVFDRGDHCTTMRRDLHSMKFTIIPVCSCEFPAFRVPVDEYVASATATGRLRGLSASK
jgi:hypothetical protein